LALFNYTGRGVSGQSKVTVKSEGVIGLTAQPPHSTTASTGATVRQQHSEGEQMNER